VNISYKSTDFKSLEGRNFRRKSLGGATLRASLGGKKQKQKNLGDKRGQQNIEKTKEA